MEILRIELRATYNFEIILTTASAYHICNAEFETASDALVIASVLDCSLKSLKLDSKEISKI